MHKSTSSLRRDFIWAVSSNVVYYGCQWGLVFALVKLGTPADVGTYALGLAVTAPILMLANFQARNLIASDARDDYDFSDYITFRATSLAAALVTTAVFAYATQHIAAIAAVIVMVGIAQASDCVSETYFGLLQKLDRIDRVSVSLLVKGPLCLGLLSVTMAVTHKVVAAVVALVAGRLLVLLFIDIPSGWRLGGSHRFTWDWLVQRRLFLTALPFGVISCFIGLNMNIPRYFIASDMNRHDLGIFSALASLLGAGNLIMASLASCVIVPLARAWADERMPLYDRLYRKLLLASAVMGLGGVSIAFLGGDRMIVRLFHPDYSGNAGVLARLMLGGAFSYLVSAQGYTMTAARKVVQQIPGLVGSTILTTLCSWLIIPRSGLNGAADAWLLSSIFLFGYNGVFLARLRRSMAKTPTGPHLPVASAIEVN